MELLDQLGAMSYLGVFGVSLIANIILPFPEEITLLALGYLSGTGVFNWIIIIPIAMLGLFISDWVLYALSYKGSRITQSIYDRLFAKRFDFLNNLQGEKLERVIVVTRFLPHFRFLAPFLSGHFKLPFRDFARHEIVSLSVYVPVFIFLGYFLRSRIERVIEGIGVFQNITIGIVVIVLGIFLFSGFKKYLKKYLNLNFLNK
jgi:membrane-associated protein